MIDTGLLNENQREAVLDDSQYLRIVAGAGSGKTRVLTMRIAHLIEDENVFPRRILAITFTNKAANEMKERLKTMLPEDSEQPSISTIHALCVRILREDYAMIGLEKNFVIVDSDDQKAILKEAYKKYKMDTQSYSYASVLSYISGCKTGDVDVQKAKQLAGNFKTDLDKANVYGFYEQRLFEMKAVDFDDLIVKTVAMFDAYPECAEKWQRRFRYIHVDEFQDIDRNQYKLIRQLAGSENNLYVVGDPDQTIYTWRGADVNIIMNYSRDFPGSKTITLNENYRSTMCILNGANSIIKNNRNRLEKDLFTNRPGDEKIKHYSAENDESEAAWIAGRMIELHSKGKKYKDMAVLYRSNYLSRSLEKAMLDARIPYVIYGGIRFYDRLEIKDCLCYLRMAQGADDLAFQRVINSPKRGIGPKTIDTISSRAAETGKTMYEVIRDEKLFSGKTQNTLSAFVMKVEYWKKLASSETYPLDQLLERIIEESGYKKALEDANENERIENLKELVNSTRQFKEDNPDATLDEYIQMVSLYGDREETDDKDYVQLMTVHAAKGLEFDTVFISDMNEGIFPNERAVNDGPHGIEEERRLAYVALTRARNLLFICEAGGYSYLLQRMRTASRFIKEIDEKYIEHVNQRQSSMRREMNFSQMSGSSGFRNENVFVRREEPAEQKNTGGKIKKGSKVHHEIFGDGTVVKIEDNIATIAFPYPHGVKKIMATHPSLTKIA